MHKDVHIWNGRFSIDVFSNDCKTWHIAPGYKEFTHVHAYFQENWLDQFQPVWISAINIKLQTPTQSWLH